MAAGGSSRTLAPMFYRLCQEEGSVFGGVEDVNVHTIIFRRT